MTKLRIVIIYTTYHAAIRRQRERGLRCGLSDLRS